MHTDLQIDLHADLVKHSKRFEFPGNKNINVCMGDRRLPDACRMGFRFYKEHAKCMDCLSNVQYI